MPEGERTNEDWLAGAAFGHLARREYVRELEERLEHLKTELARRPEWLLADHPSLTCQLRSHLAFESTDMNHRGSPSPRRQCHPSRGWCNGPAVHCSHCAR